MKRSLNKIAGLGGGYRRRISPTIILEKYLTQTVTSKAFARAIRQARFFLSMRFSPEKQKKTCW